MGVPDLGVVECRPRVPPCGRFTQKRNLKPMSTEFVNIDTHVGFNEAVSVK